MQTVQSGTYSAAAQANIPQIELPKPVNSALVDMSMSMLEQNAVNVFAQQAELLSTKAKKDLSLSKAQNLQLKGENEALNKHNNALINEIELLKKQCKANQRTITNLKSPVLTFDELIVEVNKLSEKFQSLQSSFDALAASYVTDSMEDYSLKSREFKKVFSFENKQLKAISGQVHNIFSPQNADSKAYDSAKLVALNKAWTEVSIIDKKLEKSTQHGALKYQIKEFLTKLEDSQKKITTEYETLIVEKYKAPGVRHGSVYTYILPELKDMFEQYFNPKVTAFNELQAEAKKHEQNLEKIKLSTIQDQSLFANRLAAGDFEQANLNVTAFQAYATAITTKEKELLTNLSKKWEEYKTTHAKYCAQISWLEKGLADPELTFPVRYTADQDKLLSYKVAKV